MKHHFLAIIIATCTFGYSQGVVLDEQFNDNSNLWPVFSTSESGTTAEIKQGNYVLVHPKNEGSYTFAKTNLVFPKLSYSIEAEFKLKNGAGNNPISLVFNMLNYENNYSFSINGDGSFTIVELRKNEFYTVKPWTKNKYINQSGVYNKLKIVHSGKSTSFYINNKKVFKFKDMPYKGSWLGIKLNYSMSVDVSSIKVLQDSKPMVFAPNMPPVIIKKNLGDNINTKFDEKTPVISPDGKTIYFVSINKDENVGKNEKDDIWVAVAKNDTTWNKAKNIGFPLNNEGNNSVVAVSPDNNSLYINNTYNADGSANSSGLSKSFKTETGGWSVPEIVPIKNFYNTNQYVNWFLCNDQKTMLMAVERKDTYGDMDLYVSFLGKDNIWSEPKNMGKTLNTFAADFSPFMASDNVTLYYASQGFRSFGSADIYMSKRLDNSWTKWSEPMNLGPQINSNDWDAYYNIPASGKYAYMVSEKNSIGKTDIFRLELPDAVKPNPVVIVNGKVYDQKTKAIIKADISYETLLDKKEIGKASSNAFNGEYKIVLPYGQDYGFHAMAPGYISVNENINLDTLKGYAEINHDLYLVPLEVGQSVLLNNLFFERSKAILKPESFPELDRLVTIMKENPNMEIELEGHTDSYGNAELNVQLSEDRVKTVEKYLVSKGIKEKRITGKGYGGARPIADNSNEVTRKKNRRVAFVIKKI